MSSEENEYVVENIVGKRSVRGGKVQYFVKWEGFPDTDNTWEPEENLSCPEKVEEYNRVNKDKAGPASKTAPAKRARSKMSDGAASDNDDSADSDGESTKKTTKRKSGPAKGTTKTAAKPSGRTSASSDKKTDKSPAAAAATQPFESPQKGGANRSVSKVCGCQRRSGSYGYLVQWTNGDQEIVASKWLREHAPAKLIDFFEDRIVFEKGAGANKAA